MSCCAEDQASELPMRHCAGSGKPGKPGKPGKSGKPGKTGKPG